MNKQALTIFDKKLGREVEKLNKMSVKTIEEALKKALKSQRYYVKDGGMFEMAADAPERNGKWAADKAAEMLGDALYHFLSKDLVPIAQKQYQIIEELEAGDDGPRGDLWHRAASTKGKQAMNKQAKIKALEARISALQVKVAKEYKKRLKKDLKLKNGDVIPKGTPFVIQFRRRPLTRTDWVGPSGADYTKGVNIGGITNLHFYFPGFRKPPGTRALEHMVWDGIASTVTGQKVEPDGHGPDGSPSWLLVLGMI